MSHSMNDNSNEDKQIDKLIKVAREGHQAGFVRPSDASIEAWILGSATDAQKDEVSQALIASAAFRRELLSVARDLESLTEAEVLEEFGKAEAPESVSLGAFLASAGADGGTKKSFWSSLKGLIVPKGFGRRVRESLLPRSRRLGTQVAAASLVAATLLVVFMMQMDNNGRFTESGLAISDWVAVSQMDAGSFVPNITRTPGGEEEAVSRYQTPAEAAQAEFIRLVSYEDGEYLFDTTNVSTVPAGTFRHLQLHLLDEFGDTIMEYGTSISAAPMAKLSVRVWALAIPSRILRSFDMVSDTACAVWSQGFGSRGCLTFTYEIDSAYSAAKGAVFGF